MNTNTTYRTVHAARAGIAPFISMEMNWPAETVVDLSACGRSHQQLCSLFACVTKEVTFLSQLPCWLSLDKEGGFGLCMACSSAAAPQISRSWSLGTNLGFCVTSCKSTEENVALLFVKSCADIEHFNQGPQDVLPDSLFCDLVFVAEKWVGNQLGNTS